MHNACCIRPLTAPDLPTVLAWRNHPNVRRFMFTQHEISLKEHQNWFEKANSDMSKRLLIVEDSSQPIGFVQFNNVKERGIADWGFYACPNRPKGTGQKLGTTALDYAFQVLLLHKVCGQVIGNNAKSISFHKRLGFREEGKLREHQFVASTYYDIYCLGLLSYEWIYKNLNQEQSSAKN